MAATTQTETVSTMGKFPVGMTAGKVAKSGQSTCHYFKKSLVLDLGFVKLTSSRNGKYGNGRFPGYQVGDPECFVGLRLAKDKDETVGVTNELTKDVAATTFQDSVLAELKSQHNLPQDIDTLLGTPTLAAGGGRFTEAKWPMVGTNPKPTIVKFYDPASGELYKTDTHQSYVQAMLTAISDAGAERPRKAALLIVGLEQWAAASVKLNGVCVYKKGEKTHVKLMLQAVTFVPIFEPNTEFRAMFESFPEVLIEDTFSGGMTGLKSMMGTMGGMMGGLPAAAGTQEKKKRSKKAPSPKKLKTLTAESSGDDEEVEPPRKRGKGGKAAAVKVKAAPPAAVYSSDSSEDEDEEEAPGLA